VKQEAKGSSETYYLSINDISEDSNKKVELFYSLPLFYPEAGASIFLLSRDNY
jgi:hypothetical protein